MLPKIYYIISFLLWISITKDSNLNLKPCAVIGMNYFNTICHRWTQIKCDMDEAWPPKTAGHSATLHR